MKRSFLVYLLYVSSSILVFSQVKQAGLVCCCDVWEQIIFPNFDFEDGASPPPGGFILYSAGSTFAGWTVTRATIDHVEATHAGLGNGNPNGASNFIDLHGSPGFGAISYKMTGLKPGAVYLLKFWTAQNGGGHSSTGTVKVAGGAWLDESWTVTISGAVAWFLMEYKFMAMSDMADLEFSSVGDLIYAGTLIDDISLFECPPDIEFPVVNNEPSNEEYNCLADVKRPPALIVTDNCDKAPSVKFSEKVNKISDCEIIINREWDVSDKCNNSKKITQEIKVIDKEPPIITNLGTNKIVSCSNYKLSDFNQWIATNGGTKAADNCKSVTWDNSYDRLPRSTCDTTVVAFIAKDICGNEAINYLKYIVRDSSKPIIVRKSDTVLLKCSSSSKDSLRTWLNNHGNAQVLDSCSTVFWKNNFNGDSSSLNIRVNFIAEDSCGNQTIIPGIFQQLDSPDTFNITTYQCGLSGIKMDTSLFILPGCDSVVIHRQVGVVADSSQLFYKTCDINQVPKEILSLKNRFNCDSTIILNYQFIPPDTTFLQQFVCGIPDTIINTSILAGIECDSVIIEKQIPAEIFTPIIRIKSCDQQQVGIKTFNYKSIYGCDSIITQITELSTSVTTRQDSFICGLKNNYTDTLKYLTQACDSFHIIFYQGSTIDSSYSNRLTCDPSQSGTFIKTYTGTNNCDSIHTEIVQYKAVPDIRFRLNTCDRAQKLIDTFKLSSYMGCDSFVITQFILQAIDTTFIQLNTCNKSIPLIEIIPLKGQFCDSIISIRRNLIPGYFSFIYAKTCHKDSVRIDSIKLLSSEQCDSTIIMNYSFDPISFQFKSSDISCYSYQDGNLEIFNLLNSTDPIELIVDGIKYNNIKILNNLSKGNHFVLIKDKNQCISDTSYLYINEPASIEVDLGPDLSAQKSQLINLKDLSGTTHDSYKWLPDALFDCPDCPNSNIKITNDTTIYLQVSDKNGCSSWDTLNIRIVRTGDVFAPNAFSPNGDGINDEFYLIGDENIIINYLRIYDRWGNLIFDRTLPRINQAHDGWNGIYKGHSLNPAVYVYNYSITNPDGRIEVRSGDVSLIK